MPSFRTPYGRSVGFYNQFDNHQGFLTLDTKGLIAQSATGQDITRGEIFFTNNSGTTAISNLYGYIQPNVAGIEQGRTIKLVFLDSNTTITNGGNIYLAGTGSFGSAANASIDLMYSRSGWYEVGRSIPTRTDILQNTVTRTSSLTVAGDTTVLALTNTLGLALFIIGISGGYQGQIINVVNLSGTTVELQTGGNIVCGATNALGVAQGDSRVITKIGDNWYVQ